MSHVVQRGVVENTGREGPIWFASAAASSNSLRGEHRGGCEPARQLLAIPGTVHLLEPHRRRRRCGPWSTICCSSRTKARSAPTRAARCSAGWTRTRSTLVGRVGRDAMRRCGRFARAWRHTPSTRERRRPREPTTGPTRRPAHDGGVRRARQGRPSSRHPPEHGRAPRPAQTANTHRAARKNPPRLSTRSALGTETDTGRPPTTIRRDHVADHDDQEREPARLAPGPHRHGAHDAQHGGDRTGLGHHPQGVEQHPHGREREPGHIPLPGRPRGRLPGDRPAGPTERLRPNPKSFIWNRSR